LRVRCGGHMRGVGALIFALALVACAAQTETPFALGLPPPDPTPQFEEGWPYTRAPNYPVGVWTSASGYRIDLSERGTYRVCLEACDEGIYERRGIVIYLRDFNVSEKPIARSLIQAVNSNRRRTRDLDFTPNMGPPANAEDCGGRPCVQLGTWSPRHSYTFILQEP
ncbi:MAG: hypothetical protein ABL932_10600, partial [Terricaulis sp.]